jgi:tetratricopeptide (TPR) repeat protein/transglutaminase-like putative cysteine protease
MRTLVLSACVVLSSSMSAHAQSPAAPSAARKVAAAGADAAFSLDRLYTRVRFENDGAVRRELTYWVKVLDEQGVRQFGEFPLVYQSETEDVTITEIAVQKPDGTVTSTPTSDVQDIPAMPAPGPIFADVRQKVINVRALRPDDVLRINAVWSIKKPIAPGHFWFEHSFNIKDIVRDEQLEIDVPADRAVALKIASSAPPEERGGSGAASGGRRVYRWKTSHLERPTNEPTHQPGDDLPPPDVRLSSFRNWDDFARWFTSLAFPQQDPIVKAKADALTAGAPDDAAKVAAIYRFVSTEIRYVALSFGLGRFKAHAPADVLKNQYGDCKDKAVLLGALLGAIGVEALPVLVNIWRSIDDDFASPIEFNHMIAMVPQRAQPADGTWMDATLEVAPLGMLVQPTRGKRVLILDGIGRASVVRTPADPPFPVLNEINLEGSLNSIGVLSAKVTMLFRGDAEILLRSAVRALPRTSLKDFVAAMAKTIGIDGDISAAATSEPADTKEPFRVSFSVHRRGTLDWAAERSDLTVPVKLTLEDGRQQDRKDLHKILLPSPGIERVTASIELPPSYEATAPAAVLLSRAGIGYKSTYAANGRQMTLEREVRTTAREVPESAFGEYSAMMSAIGADNAQTFKVRGAVDDSPAIPSDATSVDVYHAANDAWYAKRYAASAALYKRATEVDPKMGDAWIGLGLAYNQLKKYDEAEAAIRRQISLDLFNKRVYSDLGFVLKSAGKTADAAAAYAKHVELNPLDGDAFKELGNLYDDLDQYADEAAALEKAASLLKPDAWVFAKLGSAYIHIKSPDKARHAFDRALEIASTPAIWTKVSWQLAEAGIDLDRAEELGRKSEQQIAAETAALDLKSLTSDQLAKMETLAWTWDALGWIRFQRGDLAKAEDYARAAWLLGGFVPTASHLGQIAQKRDKLADALSFYLTAQALTDRPTPEMIDRVKRLAGGGDLKLMLDTARRMASSDRLVRLAAEPPAMPVRSANFLVVVDNQHKALDVRFEDGAESLRSVEAALRSTTYPLNVPGDLRARLAVAVEVRCDARQVCAGRVDYPSRVELKK